MSDFSKIEKEIKDSIFVKTKMLNDQKLMKKINELVCSCVSCLKDGNKIIFFGNGGSFADAQHLSAEFTSRFLFERPALASIALGTNNSGLSAMGNDYGYSQVFARELEAIGNEGDVCIAISTSGRSKNIKEALTKAKSKKIHPFALTGQSGGDLLNIASCICVPSNQTPRIQESHIMIGHIVCGLVEKTIFPEHYKKTLN